MQAAPAAPNVPAAQAEGQARIEAPRVSVAVRRGGPFRARGETTRRGGDGPVHVRVLPLPELA